ncbi:MAG: hypothetical protein ACOYN0_11200 [Phycisphaerales bacterium]
MKVDRVRGVGVFEALEVRALMSYALLDGDGDGTRETLVVDAAAKNQSVIITEVAGGESTGDVTVSFDANGNGLFTDAGELSAQVYRGLEVFDISLGAGNDRFEYRRSGEVPIGIDSRIEWRRVLFLDMGAGNDSVVVSVSLVNSQSGAGNEYASLSMEIELDAGNDTVDFTYAAPGEAPTSIFARIEGGLGNDQLDWTVGDYGWDGSEELARGETSRLVAVMGAGADLVSVSGGGAYAVRTSVGMEIDLGAGGDRFELGPGRIASGSNGSVDLARTDANLSLSVDGGAGSDSLSLTAPSLGDSTGFSSAGRFSASMRGGAGSDTASVFVPLGFEMAGALRRDGGPGTPYQAVVARSVFSIALDGGEGADALDSRVQRFGPGSPIVSAGSDFSLSLIGGDGKDTLRADLDDFFVRGGSYATADGSTVPGSSLPDVRMLFDGGQGNDIIDVAGTIVINVANPEGDATRLRVTLLGGAGDDRIFADSLRLAGEESLENRRSLIWASGGSGKRDLLLGFFDPRYTLTTGFENR